MSNRIEKGNSLIKRYVSEIISNELNDNITPIEQIEW